MYHVIFKITNLVNGMYYYAKHSTDDLNDGYMGSGTRINNAIRKHGIVSFIKEIRLMFRTEELAYEMEEYLSYVENWPDDAMCYNIAYGGAYDPAMHLIAKRKNKGWFDSEVQAHNALKSHDIQRQKKVGIWNPSHEQQRLASKAMHTPENEARRIATIKTRGSLAGKRNASYGKHWYTDGVNELMIYENMVPSGYKRGRKRDIRRTA